MDESYDATFFIGAHAMAGTINAFLDHTQSSLSWFNYSVNGRKMGELGQWAMVAGAFGVPMAMVSGDEAACVEARQFFYPLETAMVKRGVGRNRAVALPLEEARSRIRGAARRAISIVKDAKPFVPTKPMEIILEFTRADYCDSAAARGAERIDARTVRKVTDNSLEFAP
jgi:D-amino peptidase